MPTNAELASARAHTVQLYPRGYCLRFCREQWGVPPLYASAIEAWHGARWKHPGDRHPPLAAPCFYLGGQYGHIVLWCPPSHLGMRSTDCFSSGRVSDADVGWCERQWGYRYLGWSEDLNGVRVIPEEDEMSWNDWTADEKAAMADRVADEVWGRLMQVTKPNGEKEEKSAEKLQRETWSKLAEHMDSGGGSSAMRLGTAGIKNYPDMPERRVVEDARSMAELCDVWGQQENNPAEDSPAIARELGEGWAAAHPGTNLPIWYLRDYYVTEQALRIHCPFDPVLPLTPRPRWITSAVFSLRDRAGVAPFAVINVHLIAGAYNGDNSPADTARRRRQWDVEFAELQEFVKSFRRKGMTVFVLGDFNHPRPPKPVGNFQWLVGERLDRIGVTTTGGTEAIERDDGVVQLNSNHRGQWSRVLLT